MPINAAKKALEAAKTAKEKSQKDRSDFIMKNKNVNINTHTMADAIEESVSAFGKKSLPDLFGSTSMNSDLISPCLKTQRTVDPEVAHTLLNIKKAVDNCRLEMQIRKAVNGGMDVPVTSTSSFRHLQSISKAYDSTDWSSWIPQLFVNWTYEELEMPFGLDSMFETYNMTSKTQEIPLESGQLEGKKETETATFVSQSTSATSTTVTAVNNVVHVKMWGDLLQDNLDPQLFDKQRMKTAKAIQRSFEKCLLNGDPSATHMDSNITDPKDFQTAFKGLRKIAMDNSANGALVNAGGSGISLALLQNLLAALSPENEMEDLIWILPPAIWTGIITGKIPEVLTMQNVGSNATLITGNMFPLFGINAYKAGKLPQKLNANGVYDGITETMTTMGIINKTRFSVGLRAPIRFWISAATADEDSLSCSAKARHTFGGVPQSATEVSCVFARNLTY